MRLGFLRTSWLSEITVRSTPEQVTGVLAILQRAKPLTLTNPAIQFRDLDGVDLAEQIARECVNSDARILVSFVVNPSVAG